MFIYAYLFLFIFIYFYLFLIYFFVLFGFLSVSPSIYTLARKKSQDDKIWTCVSILRALDTF